MELKESYTVSELLEIMAFLRGADGCAWDRAQTHHSLRANLLEEAYEAIEAIEGGDPERLCDELGDVLMQVVFHAQIARENSQFGFADVVSAISQKLISRHTHIFGSDRADTPAAVSDNWEKNKFKEKGLRSFSEVLEDVPRTLPALLRSYKIQKKAANAGFDWPDVEGARAKIYEELTEVAEVAKSGSDSEDPEKLELEIGDLLFSVVNYARHLGIEPELALRRSSEKFIERFTQMENKIIETGRQMTELDLAALDQFWDQVKDQEKEL